jgi:AcrR family transcriptional regulator
MVVVTPAQTRTKRRRARSFENLVQAGLAVIGKRGLYETTVEHITEAADVGKGTFYAHFASKEDLVFHLVRHGFDELCTATTAQRRPNRTPVTGVAALILGQLQTLARRRDLVILLHQVRGLLILQPTARDRLRQEYRRYVDFLMRECRQVLGAASLSEAEAQALACAIAGFVAGTLSFEMLVRGNRGAVSALRRPVTAFATGVVARYAPRPVARRTRVREEP